jgi:hypothetical protein
MKEHYESSDIHKALEHALRYHAFDGRAVERILKARAQERTLESVRNEKARKDLEEALPRIVQRSLHAYTDLLETDDEDTAGRDPDQDQRALEDLETDRDAEGP